MGIRRMGSRANKNQKRDVLEIIMEMNYQKRIIAYMDILGFSDKVLSTIDKDTGEEIVQKTNKINSLFENVKELKRKYKRTDNDVSSKRVSHFSDTVVISYLLEEEAGILHILINILSFCVSVLQNGYLIRGAITCGNLHHFENELYGPAMLTAYDMEKKIAFYPRIVFEKKIIDIAEKYPAKWLGKAEQLNSIKRLIQKDFDGLYYLDYFNSIDYFFGPYGLLTYLKAFKYRIIELQNKINNDNSIKSKYFWLKEKYNIALKRLRRKYLKEKINIEHPELYNFLINEVDINER